MVAPDPRCLAATQILDWHDRGIADLAASIGLDEAIDVVRAAHGEIGRRVRPVYGLNERQRASHTLRTGRGSCSQRFAVLEAVARASGIPTMVRGLSVDGRFWYPRFPRFKWLIPSRVVLAWPTFLIEEDWVSASDLFRPPQGTERAFRNDGETLFDAIDGVTIDWDGIGVSAAASPGCDLSGMVGRDLGMFTARDDLFDRYQTFPRAVQLIADPVLRRWAPRADPAGAH
jgi:Transglutaminase-like superfamily